MKSTHDILTINITDIGNVSFIKSKKAKKNISIKIDHTGLIRVTYPYFTNIKEAKKLVKVKKEWIIAHQQKIFKRETFLNLAHNSILKSHTSTFSIQRINNQDLQTPLKIDDNHQGSVKFHIRHSIENMETIQDQVHKYIIKTLRKDAKAYIIPHTKRLASSYKLKYNDIKIKNVKSRWGSCSSNNNLNFNLYLMLLPQELINYVILHELAHTIEKNHQKPFWQLLDSFTNNQAKLIDKKLSQYHIGF